MPNKTICNYVAAYNNFESSFAQYLDKCPDILKFSALATTGQGANGQFKVNYLNQNGAIRVMKYPYNFQKNLSVHLGVVVTNITDIHSKKDLKELNK